LGTSIKWSYFVTIKLHFTFSNGCPWEIWTSRLIVISHWIYEMKPFCDDEVALHIASTRSSMRELNIEIDCHLMREKVLSREIKILSILVTSWQMCSPSCIEALGLSMFVTNLVHMTYILQLEGSVKMK